MARSGKGLRFQSVHCRKWLHRAEPSQVHELNLHIPNGSRCAWTGPTASGRNLALHLAALLEEPDSGEIWFEGQSLTQLSTEDRLTVRTSMFGCVLDAPYLLPSLSVLENVATPLLKSGLVDHNMARERTERILRMVGVLDDAATQADSMPLLDQYRTSLARALISMPRVLLLEEPERHLDGHEIVEWASLVKCVGEELGITIIWSCHQSHAAFAADCVHRFENGRAGVWQQKAGVYFS